MVTTIGSETKETATAVYIWRGLGYALTSIATLISGYTIQSHQRISYDTVLVLIPLVLSFLFFVFYAICFDYSKENDIVHQNEATWFSIVITILISIVLVLIYEFKAQSSLTGKLFLSMIIYTGAFLSYGWFLKKKYQNTNNPPTRHQLVWPVFLTIGFSLYYGLFFNEFATTLAPFIPLSLILGYFVFAEFFKLKVRAFSLIGLLVLIVATLLIILGGFGIVPIPGFAYISSLIFCIYIAAYLGVFESWRITSHIARKTRTEQTQTAGAAQPAIGGKVVRFYIATLAVLIGSTFFIPSIQFVSKYGVIFHAGFIIHALFAIYWWMRFGTDINHLRQKNWNRTKLFFGFILLALLVFDSKFNYQPAQRIFEDSPASWSAWLMGPGVVYWIARFVQEINEAKETPRILKHLFSKSINIIRTLGILSIVSCFVILVARALIDKSSPILFKLEFAYISYLLLIVFCGFVEIINQTNRFTQYFTPVLGIISILKLIRFFTSLFIALTVILPYAVKGFPLSQAILAAIPLFLAAAGGFSLNDYFDSAKDKINKPHRVIPSKRLSPNSVLIIALIFIAMATMAVFLQQTNTIQKIIYFSSIIGVILYNPIVKYFGYFKTIYTAILCILPVLYDLVVLKYSGIYFLIPLSTMIFVVGRELLMDVTDIRGDLLGEIKTIPMILGIKLTTKIGFCLLFVGSSILLPLVLRSTLLVNSILLCCIFISIFIMYVLWRLNSRNLQRAIIISLWFPMLCGLVMLLV